MYEEDTPLYSKILNKYIEVTQEIYDAQTIMSMLHRTPEWWTDRRLADDLAYRWRRVDGRVTEISELCERMRGECEGVLKKEPDRTIPVICHRLHGDSTVCGYPHKGDLPCSRHKRVYRCSHATRCQFLEEEGA